MTSMSRCTCPTVSSSSAGVPPRLPSSSMSICPRIVTRSPRSRCRSSSHCALGFCRPCVPCGRPVGEPIATRRAGRAPWEGLAMRAPRVLAAIALAVSALCATACSSAPGDSGDDGLLTIHVGVSPAAGSSTPMYLAVAQGVFRKQGLDVRLEPSTDGTVVVPRLMNGQLQFCMSSFGPFVSAAEKNLPIKMVAPVNRQQSDGHYTAIIVPSGSKATDLSQVHVFAQQEGQPDPLSQLAVTRLGGDYKAMRLLAVPLGSVADAVGGGSADAGRLFQPFLAQALAKGKVRVLRYITADVTLPGVPSAIFLGNQSYLTAHPDVAKRFVEGV